jgi:putative membrane protein
LIGAITLVLFGTAAPGAAADAGAAMDDHGPAGMALGDDENVSGDQDPADHDTPSGPLSQYDRNLLINVRWANLWEAPISDVMAARSANARVREVAATLAKDHHNLESVVTDAATRLGVPLPGSPTPLQQQWMADISSKSGTPADEDYANYVREAHGTIFMLISQVRAQTRNDVMRAFAQRANDIVMRHMTLLESIGMVRSSSLYVGSTETAPYQILPSRNKVLLGIVLGVFVFVGTFAVVREVARSPRESAE